MNSRPVEVTTSFEFVEIRGSYLCSLAEKTTYGEETTWFVGAWAICALRRRKSEFDWLSEHPAPDLGALAKESMLERPLVDPT